MSDGIKFFTAQLKPGEVAQFQLMTTAPWGMHHIRGAIIMSQATNSEAVVWPRSAVARYRACRWTLDLPACAAIESRRSGANGLVRGSSGN